jgi:hypothetical protein
MKMTTKQLTLLFLQVAHLREQLEATNCINVMIIAHTQRVMDAAELQIAALQKRVQELERQQKQ